MTCNSILTWFGNSCRTGECPISNILGLSRLNALADPLYMEPNGIQVFLYYRERRSRHNPDHLCRPSFGSNHACWPAPPAPSWWWHVRTDPHPLETGAVAVLSRPWFFQSILMSFASQGSHLAITYYNFRDPSSSKSGHFAVHSLFVYLRFTV